MSRDSQIRLTHVYGARGAVTDSQDCFITLARTLRVSLTSVLNSEAPEPDALLSVRQLSLSSVPGCVLKPPPEDRPLLDSPQSTSEQTFPLLTTFLPTPARPTVAIAASSAAH